MSIFDRIFSKQPIIQQKQAPMVMYQNIAKGYSKKESYSDFAEEGYQQNAIVYRCVNEISQGAASVAFNVFSGDTALENHPLISLLDRPNPLMAGVEYFQCLYSHLIISGNAFAVRSIVNGIPRELHLLRPDRVRIVPSKTNVPAKYEYVINGRVVESYDVDPDTGVSDVKHFKMFNPLDDYLGMSPVKAASLDIDQHNLAASHNVSLLNNGARPSGAIVFNPKDDSGASIQLTDGQRQQLLTDLESRFTGTGNTGRAMLLEGDFDWKEMGLSPKDMDFLQLKNMSARDIALCFGVPAQLVGVPDGQTYNNIAEARLALYEETIIPLMKRLESDMNEWLTPMFDGEDLVVSYDYDNIPAMAERRKMIYENVIAAVREGIISRNEARERLDLSPVEGGDDVYISANLFPLGSPEISPQEQEVDPEDAEKDVYGNGMGEVESKALFSKEEVRKDVFTNQSEAQQRAEEIGCIGYHAHDEDGEMVYMPCKTHEEYTRLTGEDIKDEDAKAESDIDTVPTEEMARNAERGLKLRKEFNRGGTEVGVARAVQLTNRERLSPRTVRRMHSFFSRHEVDKRAEGFRQGEDGYPSAGLIAWLLWGGNSAQTWARRKVAQLDKERDESKQISDLFTDTDVEEKAELSEKMKKAIANKVKEHNDKHGDKKGKRVTQRMLEAVFRRGVGAYNTNPESVRPSVSSPDQWALARVNVFLQAVRTGKFKRGKFDRDLLPKDHPLRSE